MTTITAAPHVTTPRTFGTRVRNVMRLHLANPWTPIYIPAMILTFIFALNYVLWAIIDSAGGAEATAHIKSGGTSFVLIYMMVVAVQAMNLTFPFALGFGITRRDFYLGSSAFFVVLSAVYAAVLGIMAEIERANNGWGFGVQFFAPTYLGFEGALPTFAFYFLALLLFFFLGSAIAGVYVRWRSNGMLVFFAGLALLLVGVLWLISATGTWQEVGQFFTDNGALGVAWWTLIITGAAAITGYSLLRRATPRN